ncbi:MAG: DUF418 domain-containing protein [Sphingomonadaceae bacterium]|nr:DUF418 domain-containing protein [Sphingomonadaceae bacterium]
MLGILAINIAGFAGPSVATLSPHLPFPGTLADEYSFAVKFVLFEGKMRTLFSLLFGASLVLFIERADSKGSFGDLLQLRRLGWLALFGLAHFYLFWWGDILFIYAVAGMIALIMREMNSKPLILTAIAIYSIWHFAGAALSYPGVAMEENTRLDTATAAQEREYSDYLELVHDNARNETRQLSGSFIGQVESRAVGKTFRPLVTAFSHIGETLPLMLLGMALLRTGFFSGTWQRRHLWLAALVGTGSGLAMTFALLGWAWSRGFAPKVMEAITQYWAGMPHVLMGVGYAAFLVLAAPALARMPLGRWLSATGRMAFSTYLGTTVLMTAIFYGWGLGWIGRFGHAWQWPFVFLGWAVMVIWSTIWLRRFKRGPLEWAWRSLVEGRLLPNQYRQYCD